MGHDRLNLAVRVHVATGQGVAYHPWVEGARCCWRRSGRALLYVPACGGTHAVMPGGRRGWAPRSSGSAVGAFPIAKALCSWSNTVQIVCSRCVSARLFTVVKSASIMPLEPVQFQDMTSFSQTLLFEKAMDPSNLPAPSIDTLTPAQSRGSSGVGVQCPDSLAKP